MRWFCLLPAFLVVIAPLSAEGTKQLAPNGSISIAGNQTTDIAALHIGNTDFDNFADYSNTDPNNRLYIHIQDPEQECIYLGFSLGHRNVTSPNPTQVGYEYRIKDPAGNVVFGPIIVNPADANIANWSQGFTGPMQLHGDDGYNALLVSAQDLMSGGWTGKGDYYVEFRTLTGASDFLIDFWDITVANCSGTFPEERPGRVWSFNWSIFAINDFGFPNRPFNGAFYVCAPDPDNPDAAFITKIDFNGSGFMPAAFNIAFNSFGVNNTGNVMEDRRSVELVNATQAEYAVFLNDPVDICATAEVGEIELHGVSRCDPSSFCIRFSASKEGQVDLLLDFDGNDLIYTPGTADVMVAVQVAADQINVPTCIDWDGHDGLGNPLPEDAASEIPVVISYAQGIYHFPVYDAELMINGFSVEAVRPAADQPLLFYDDSNITVPSGSGEPSMQLTGCVLPCHRWSNFTNNSIPGFGNLHTINSWWFSQLIIREHVFSIPASLSCSVTGPATICAGDTAQLVLETSLAPMGAEAPEIIAAQWSGPGIAGTAQGSSIKVVEGGLYMVDVLWQTVAGDTCMSSCQIALATLPESSETIEILIVQGDSVEINGEIFTKGGQYQQTLTAANGCDSLLTIIITALQTVVSFNLDGCRSYIDDGSNMDYSEFIPDYPQPLSCAQTEASILFRENPEENRHSCTPGVNDTPAICISSLDTCSYVAGHEKALIFDVTFTPASDTAIAVRSLSFFERAPEMFSWIDGPDGLNNYPTRYGVRVLKNGVEVYRAEDIPTTTDWTPAEFSFDGFPEFIISDEATFRFELLPYCLIGNDASVTAWDLDEINVVASCASPGSVQRNIFGAVRTTDGEVMPFVEVRQMAPGQPARFDTTDLAGHYAFEDVGPDSISTLTAHQNGDVLNGVSTLDLIRIQQHLLGLRPFDSPYDMIAADVNRSHSVSTSDLLVLRRVLLGVQSGFTNNTSWRFGDAAQELSLGNPWSWREEIVVAEDDALVDFTGIKVGDVTGDATPDFRESAESRSPGTISLLLEQKVQDGHIAYVIRSKELVTLTGLQAIICFGEQILDVQDGFFEMKDRYAVSADGQTLRIVWSDVHGVDLQPGSLLFTIVTSGSAPTAPPRLDARSAIVPEAYSAEGLPVRLTVDHGPPGIGTDPNLTVHPNPMYREAGCSVTFTVTDPSVVSLDLYDIAGHRVFSANGRYPAGRHVITLGPADLPDDQGILICRVQSSSWSRTIPLILLH